MPLFEDDAINELESRVSQGEEIKQAKRYGLSVTGLFDISHAKLW